MKRNATLMTAAGILIGTVGTILFFTAASKAQGPLDSDRSNCKVQVGQAVLTGGYQCSFNRVLVGHWNNNLYCANLTVSCDN
ncbi:MAG: hypothetical protein NT027_14220 [Proteobacteria bacterium]|nr:hypothetical protein [Pseudomonadota bacterium]